MTKIILGPLKTPHEAKQNREFIEREKMEGVLSSAGRPGIGATKRTERRAGIFRVDGACR
jgi:hypothetical protein